MKNVEEMAEFATKKIPFKPVPIKLGKPPSAEPPLRKQYEKLHGKPKAMVKDKF